MFLFACFASNFRLRSKAIASRLDLASLRFEGSFFSLPYLYYVAVRCRTIACNRLSLVQYTSAVFHLLALALSLSVGTLFQCLTAMLLAQSYCTLFNRSRSISASVASCSDAAGLPREPMRCVYTTGSQSGTWPDGILHVCNPVTVYYCRLSSATLTRSVRRRLLRVKLL